MKHLIITLLILGFATNFVHAQDSIPQTGTFYLQSYSPIPAPFPFDPYGGTEPIVVLDATNHIYLIQDTPEDRQSMESMNSMSMLSMDSLTPGDGGSGGSEPNFPQWSPPTNGELWLEITNVSNGTAFLNIHNATNYVYEIWTKTNLLDTNWNIETEVFPSDTNCMPFNFPTLNRNDSLFVWGRDWTGITSLGNLNPEWWFWYWFHTTNAYDSDLDTIGNSLRYDYTHGKDPNIIQFTIGATNLYLNTSLAPMQVNLYGGVPANVSTVESNNIPTNTVWSSYISSNIVGSVNAVDGQHKIWVGLKGYPTNATISWANIIFNFDSTPPMVVITNPIVSTVSVPIIQVQGYANEDLSSVTFSVSNAVGVSPTELATITGQFYDTNLMMTTTDYFQCYDVSLTNGLNIVTVYATDLAGNTSTNNLNITLDYSGDTTPPSLNVVWPQNLAKISGTNFTVQAQVSDPQASVSATFVDADGDTNIVQGAVQRDGTVWVQNLPLASGTNQVTLTAKDAAGNTTTTNFSVVQSTANVTVDPVGDLGNNSYITVTGTVNDPADNVTVNGVAATVNSDGTWEADDVPVSPDGLASLDVEVTDSSNNSVASTTLTAPQDVPVIPTYYDFQYTADLDPSRSVLWSLGEGDMPNFNWQYQQTRDDYASYQNGAVLFYNTYHIRTKVALDLGNAGSVGGNNMYLVMAEAREPQEYDAGPDLPLPPEWLKICGQQLADSGISDGNEEWGATIINVPSGVGLYDITPVATQVYENWWDYIFNVQAFKIDMQLEWTNDVGNLPIEDNTNPATGALMSGGGKRIFVGALTPTENNLHDTVLLKAKLSVPVAGIRIYFRAFDVDDATPEAFDKDPNTGQPVLDTNGKVGDDNYETGNGVGTFTQSHINDIYADTDTNGEATVEFQVSSQPGDNYRIAATWDSSQLINLNVTIPDSSTYIPANDSQVPKFYGIISPMLTVWRKLHIEVDSMQAVSTNGSQANFRTGTVSGYVENSPIAGESTIHMSTSTVFVGSDNECENGHLDIDGFASLPVVSNYYNGIENFVVIGMPGTNVIGQNFKVYDDDDRFLDTIGLPPALPKDGESTNIIAGIQGVYAPAYIEVVNANAEGFNLNKEISFALNANMGITGAGVFDDAQDLHDSTYFWAHIVTFGYQADTSEDKDPNTEDDLLGVTLKKSLLFEGGVSAIFTETIRDDAIDAEVQNFINSTNLYAGFRSDYWGNIYGTVAHEIGHGPGGNSEASDHDEGGLMQAGGETIYGHSFTPVTIKRFRNAGQWSQ